MTIKRKTSSRAPRYPTRLAVLTIPLFPVVGPVARCIIRSLHYRPIHSNPISGAHRARAFRETDNRNRLTVSSRRLLMRAWPLLCEYKGAEYCDIWPPQNSALVTTPNSARAGVIVSTVTVILSGFFVSFNLSVVIDTMSFLAPFFVALVLPRSFFFFSGPTILSGTLGSNRDRSRPVVPASLW